MVVFRQREQSAVDLVHLLGNRLGVDPLTIAGRRQRTLGGMQGVTADLHHPTGSIPCPLPAAACLLGIDFRPVPKDRVGKVVRTVVQWRCRPDHAESFGDPGSLLRAQPVPDTALDNPHRRLIGLVERLLGELVVEVL